MDNEKAGKAAGGFLSSIFPSLPKEIRYFIGGLIAFFLFQMMIYGLVYLPTYIKNIAKKSGEPNQPCWTLQKIDTQLFKVNSCTGEVIPYNPQSKSP
jgi:hypothetical protein